MILRITFNDNDYGDILKDIGKKMFTLYSYYRMTRLTDRDNQEQIKEYCDDARDLDKYLSMIQDEKRLTSAAKERFIELVAKSLKAYIEDTYKEDAEYLLDELEVEIVNSVKDQWENGEVLYYLPMNDQYLIM